jgi:hypothetical protein
MGGWGEIQHLISAFLTFKSMDTPSAREVAESWKFPDHVTRMKIGSNLCWTAIWQCLRKLKLAMETFFLELVLQEIHVKSPFW